jgi:cell fate (sporulation/competence/biofilm development) regulator YlbF (YheA/YmcA/DUF963 family)
MISDPSTASTTINNDPFQAAQGLANVLSETPEYRGFLAACKAFHNDVIVQKLSTEMHSHQTALHWGRDPDGQHAAELARIELQIQEMPVFKEYREREKEVSVLFQTVDKIISQESGLDFAVNAQHTGCSCGG